MNIDKNSEEEQKSFEYKLLEISDEEIISILRYREHFQAHARNAAIKEALKREIISSIEDLEKDEFKAKPLPPRNLFPIATTNKQNLLLLKSLCKIFYGIGLLPFIHGVIRLFKSDWISGFSFVIIGSIVFYIANRLDKTIRPFFAQLLLALTVPAIGYAIYRLMQMGQPTIMDIFATLIVIGVLLYTTFYANKITSHFNEQNEQSN